MWQLSYHQKIHLNNLTKLNSKHLNVVSLYFEHAYVLTTFHGSPKIIIPKITQLWLKPDQLEALVDQQIQVQYFPAMDDEELV